MISCAVRRRAERFGSPVGTHGGDVEQGPGWVGSGGGDDRRAETSDVEHCGQTRHRAFSGREDRIRAPQPTQTKITGRIVADPSGSGTSTVFERRPLQLSRQAARTEETSRADQTRTSFQAPFQNRIAIKPPRRWRSRNMATQAP
ncbi:hypothetical protein BH23PLA1_BH23PLA1_25400 [soil metagenome]